MLIEQRREATVYQCERKVEDMVIRMLECVDLQFLQFETVSQMIAHIFECVSLGSTAVVFPKISVRDGHVLLFQVFFADGCFFPVHHGIFVRCTALFVIVDDA